MSISTAEAIDLGRAVVEDGRLKALRETLGLTRNAMAELLHTAWPTYQAWETRRVHLRVETAARVGRFYGHAMEEISLLTENGIVLKDLIPFHVAATLLGLPQEQLLYRYRKDQFEAVDLGLLGLWIHKNELAKLRK